MLENSSRTRYHFQRSFDVFRQLHKSSLLTHLTLCLSILLPDIYSRERVMQTQSLYAIIATCTCFFNMIFIPEFLEIWPCGDNICIYNFRILGSFTHRDFSLQNLKIAGFGTEWLPRFFLLFSSIAFKAFFKNLQILYVQFFLVFCIL